MGLILDSSVVIAAERRGDTVEKLIEQVISVTGDQDAALSSVGLTELVHGVYRAQTPAMRLRRQSFIDELLSDLTIYPYTKATALLAGKIDGEQQAHDLSHAVAGGVVLGRIRGEEPAEEFAHGRDDKPGQGQPDDRLIDISCGGQAAD